MNQLANEAKAARLSASGLGLGQPPHWEAPRRPGKRRDQTAAVRTAIESDRQFGAVVPPLFLSSNFTFEEFGQKRAYDYTRSGNPTRDALAAALTELESGVGAAITSSGMAAVTLATQLLEPGQLLIAPHDCYGGTYRLFESLSRRGQFDVQFVDQTDIEAVERALERRPRLLWIETPSNPLLRITDIRALSERARQVGALTLVDNTFLSPALQKPLELGADLALHSTTKYLNGHSDVVGGAVVAKSLEVLDQLDFWANCLGLSGAPFDAYLTLRGVRTLHARLKTHERNARALAELLASHPAVERVYYPGLSQHPGHEIARKQQRGFGAMISFRLEGGLQEARTFVENLECFSLAESLGGVESLIAHPVTMTHASMPAKAREHAGVDERLLRLSVGIEDQEDLVDDVDRALAACGHASRQLLRV